MSKSKTPPPPLYSTRPEWEDVTPIPLIETSSPDAGPPLAAIAYSERYLDAMSFLRAVMAANEYSRRCLDLTADIIAMNPAHYTVWLYRARILRELKAQQQRQRRRSSAGGEVRGAHVVSGVRRDKGVVEDELEWLEDVAERNLKNYQIWYVFFSIYCCSCLSTS